MHLLFLFVIPEGNPRSSQMLNLQQIEAAITGTQFATHLVHLPSTPSTNTLALEAAQAGAETGVWVADEQTAGRGRGGHTWHSQAGEGLYVSVLIRPTLPMKHALWLSLATGLAAQSAIAKVCHVTPDLRWPNDLLLGECKLGGILVETAVIQTSALRHAVIGVGINVNHAAFPPELADAATSLRLATGQPQAREPLLIALLTALDRELILLQQPAPDILSRFAAASTYVLGKRVHVAEQGGYTGLTAGLDAAGFLLVDDDGTRRTVLSGGVRALS